MVVVSHNGGPLLHRLVVSILSGTYRDLEIVIIDNGSNDDSISGLQAQIQEDSRLKVLRLESNEPLTKAFNFGIRASSGEILGLVHNDVTLAKTWLAECLNVLLRNPQIGAVQGKIYHLSDSILDSCGCEVDSHGCEHDRGQGEPDFGQYETETSIFSASGVASIFRRDALIDAGMFDEHYGSGLDDLDLCWRLKLLGYFITYAPKGVAYHGRGTTWKSSQKLQLIVRSEFAKTRLYVPFKNFQVGNLLKNLPILLLHNAGGFFQNIRDPKGSLVYMKAMAWFLLNLGELNIERGLVQHRIRRVSDKEVFSKASEHCNLVRYTIAFRRSFNSRRQMVGVYSPLSDYGGSFVA